MNAPKYILLFIAVLSLINCSTAKPPNDATVQLSNWEISPSLLDTVKDQVSAFPKNTQVSFALIKNGQAKYIGSKTHVDTVSFIKNSQKVFEIGSISKVFTSLLLSHALSEDRVALHHTIDKFFPDSVQLESGITFKELANHTSGLPRMPTNMNLMLHNPMNPYEHYNDKMLLEYFTNEYKVVEDSLKVYDYSNLGAGTLGYLLTKLFGQSYESLIQGKICDQYQMTHTTTDRAGIESDLLVSGMNYVGQEIPNWDFDVLVGAGGLLSSAEDLSKFVLAQFETKDIVVSTTHLPTSEISSVMSVGLGWHINTKNIENIIWHNGGTMGYTACMALNKDKEQAVIVLSNVSAFHKARNKIDDLCFRLLESLGE